MTTQPDDVRAELALVAASATAETEAVVSAGETPEEIRAALFAATPLILHDYTDGAMALALDWYEELREEAAPSSSYTPTPLRVVTDDAAALVARTTEPLYRLMEQEQEPIEAAVTEAARLLTAEIERKVTDSFRETVTQNVERDPGAGGWKRFARPEACKFCKMLAARGAVYSRATARFAAHGAVVNGEVRGGNCMCIAGPEFGGKDVWAEATPMQYVASQRERTDKERAALRDYLNENFPDAPG